MGDPRADLRGIYEAGLDRVRGFDAVRNYLEVRDSGSGDVPFLPYAHLVAVGKAASMMARGALDSSCGDRIIDGLVITKHGHVEDDLAKQQRIECIESDHPVPGVNTLRAGERLLEYLFERAKGDARFLFLLSGGTSSLVEVPAGGMELDDLRDLTRQLLASGLDITQMNRVRRSVSGIKGGRLAAHLNRCSTVNLMISDVPGDDPGVIGSGLLTPVRETVDPDDCPGAVRELLERVELVPVPGAAEFEMIESEIIACLDDAKRRCEATAESWGYRRKLSPEPAFVQGDVAEAAEVMCRQLHASRGEVLIWGGEPTVKLPDKPGRGGRNQQLALSVALKIKGEPGTYFLSAGTDGTDGPTADAGALVDGGTVERGEKKGLDAEDCLRRADAGTFLDVSGDLVTTGPTGTNVMDLMIGLRGM